MMKKRALPKLKADGRNIRVQVLLEPHALQFVDAEAKAFGTSRCGAVRAIIKEAMRQKSSEAVDAPEECCVDG